jgi:putative GTP pyrophosphokinase
MPLPTAHKSRHTKGEVNRAGALIRDLKERLDRDGAAPLEEDEDRRLDEAWDALTWWRSLHARPLSTVAANLRYHVDQAGGRLEDRIVVTQRLKRLPTLIEKLGRESGSVTQMHDIGGVRAVLPTLRHVSLVRRRLLKSWTIIRERDYIERPKDSGYRAVHLIVRRSGYVVEVQLRTFVQDLWANTVENLGRNLGQDLKSGTGNPQVLETFSATAELLAAFDRGDVSADNVRVGLEFLPLVTITE